MLKFSVCATRRSVTIARFVLATALAASGRGASAQTSTATPMPTPGQVFRTSQHDFRLEVVAMLQHPHSIAFTPEGDMLITERPGRLRIVRQGKLLPTPVAGLPDGALPRQRRHLAGWPRAGRAA
jgi:glucose/arabinose dehydrogenase